MGNEVNRRVTYKLYPSRTQLAALARVHHLHRMLYNAAREERIEAWARLVRDVPLDRLVRMIQTVPLSAIP